MGMSGKHNKVKTMVKKTRMEIVERALVQLVKAGEAERHELYAICPDGKKEKKIFYKLKVRKR